MFNRPPYSVRKVLPFFPSAPDEALIFSRCIAYHVLANNRSVRASKIILFDNEYARSVDPFGANLGKLILVLPSDSISVDNLFEHATLFGFYSIPLSPERKRLWRQNQLSGDARLINKFVTGSSGHKIRLIKEHLNFCRMCRSDDEMQYGIAHWRTVHQLPGVAHCPTHLIPLSGVCAKCRVPTASEDSWHPPSETCPHCGAHVFFEEDMTQLPAHLRFVELCNLAASGIPVGLASADRKQLYSQFYPRASTSIDQRIEKLIEVLLKHWEVESLEQLQSLLQVVISRKFLAQALTSQDTIQSPGGHIAVIAALEGEGYMRSRRGGTKREHEVRANNVFSDDCRKILAELGCGASALLKAIERICDFQGLPAQMGIMLVDGTQVDTTRLFQVDQYRGAKLLVALDEIDFNVEGITASSEPKGSEFSFSSLRIAMKWHRVRNGHRASIQALLLHKQDDLASPQEALLRSVIWSGKYDHAWLKEIYALDEPVSGKARTTSRNKIVDAIKNGHRIAFSVRRTAPIAFELCRLCDAEWLNSMIPPTKYTGLSFTDKRDRCRRKIMIAIEAGITKRVNMPKRVIRWCSEHDREWLKRTVPRQSTGGSPNKR